MLISLCDVLLEAQRGSKRTYTWYRSTHYSLRRQTEWSVQCKAPVVLPRRISSGTQCRGDWLGPTVLSVGETGWAPGPVLTDVSGVVNTMYTEDLKCDTTWMHSYAKCWYWLYWWWLRGVMTSIPSCERMAAFEFSSTVKSSSTEANDWWKSAPYLATGPWGGLMSRRRLCSKIFLKCYLELPSKPFGLKTATYATRFTVFSFSWNPEPRILTGFR
jgi:hypothetical protein